MEDDTDTTPELMLEDSIESETKAKEALERAAQLEASIARRWKEIEREKRELELLFERASCLASEESDLQQEVSRTLEDLRERNAGIIRHTTELERRTNERIEEMNERMRPLLDLCMKEKALFLQERSRQEAAVYQIDLERENSIEFCGKGQSKFPHWILEANKLTSLNVSNNQFVELPNDFGDKLSGLVSLSVAQNQIRSLPISLGKLIALQTLDLGGNLLSSLSDNIGDLTSLIRLDVYNNALTVLPPRFCALSNLTELNMSNNRLSALPEDIGNLTFLINLHLSSNELSRIPSSLSLLSNLSELRLNANNLNHFPCIVFSLPSLRKLDLSFNTMSDPPMSPEFERQLEAVTQLEYINLENNRLRDLSWLNRIGSNILLLNAKNNAIERLESEMFERHSLMQHLDLQNNRLKTLPESIKSLAAIEFLNISSNPFQAEILCRISGLNNKSTCAQQIKKITW